MTGSEVRGPGGVESLYPFLYEGRADLEAVLDEVRRSTAEKAIEIVELRERVLEQDGERLEECARAMADSFRGGGKLFAFGNGGSSSDAQDVASGFLHPPAGARPLPAYSLTSDIAVVTALANDIGFDVVFARQIAAFGRRGDIAMGISTSGNSENLVRAFEEAGRRGLITVGLAVHRIQEAQTTVFHVLWELTHAALEESLLRT
jgi:D-sedoheptulose 7-phosphate isomerase